MFLSANDNLAQWFIQYQWAYYMAPNHVCNPARFDDLIRANDNKRPIRVWIPDKVYQCATTLNIGCSYISPQPLYKEKNEKI